MICRKATLSDRIPPPTGVVRGPLMEIRRSRAALTESSGSQLLRIAKRPSRRQDFKPLHRPAAAVGLFHRGIEDPLRGTPDVAARAVAFDKRDDGMVRNLVYLAIGILNRLAPLWARKDRCSFSAWVRVSETRIRW